MCRKALRAAFVIRWLCHLSAALPHKCTDVLLVQYSRACYELFFAFTLMTCECILVYNISSGQLHKMGFTLNRTDVAPTPQNAIVGLECLQ